MNISNRLKAVVIILTGLSLGCMALLAGVVWYVNSTHCRSLLLKELNAMIPGRVTVAHHHLSLHKAQLSLRDITVKDQQDDDLVRIAGLSVDLSPTAIFRRALVIDSVNIEQPWVFLRMGEYGRLNIVDAFAGEKAQGEAPAPSNIDPLFNIILRRFKLSDGYVRYSETQGSRYLNLKDIEITANGNLLDRSGVLKLSVGDSSMVYSGYSSHFKNFDLALAINEGHIEPLVIKTENQFASLLLYGDIYQAFSDPELDLTVDVDIALREAEAFFGLDRVDSGRVKAIVSVKGKPDNPRLNLKADYGGGSIEGLNLDRAGLGLDLTDRVATLDHLSIDTGFGLLEISGQTDLRSVFPKGFLSLPGDWAQTSYNGRLRTAAFELAAIPWNRENISGKMDTQLIFEGKGLSLETLAVAADAMIEIEDFRSKGMEQPLEIQSRLTCRMQTGTLWLDSMEVAAADMYFSADGSLDLDAEHVEAQFSLETREVASLLSIFGVSQIKGAVAANGHVQGRPTNPNFNVSATGQGVRVRDIDFGNVMFEAGLDEAGRLAVGTLSIENRGSSLIAEGDIQLFAAPFELHPEMPLSARLDFSNVEYNNFLADAFPDPDIQGSLGGEVVLSGKVRSLKASVDVLAKGIEVEQIRLGDLAGKARLLDGTLFLDSLRLTSNRTDLKARGEITLLRQDTWQTVENPLFKLDLADGHLFLGDFNEELSGELSIDTDLAGRLKAPRGSLTINGNNLDLGVQQIEMLAVNVQAGDRQVLIETLDVAMSGGGAIKGKGRVGYDRSFQFQVQAHEFPIDSIDRVRELKKFGGQLDLDIQGSGLLHRPEIAGQAKWSGIRVKDEKIDDLQVQFGLKDNRIFLEGKQTFDLFAEYDLLRKAFSMDLTMNNTRLEPWCAIAGRPELGGHISGSVRAEGYAGDLERTRATIDVQNLDLEFKGDRIAGTTDLQGTFNNGNFIIPIFHMDLLDQGHLAIEGSGDISGEVDLMAEGEIPMKTANLFAPDLHGLKGTVLLMTSIKGSLNSPEVEGVIRVEQGGMKIPELQQELHKVNGQIRFVANEDVEGRFSGMLDEGKFDIEMKIELDGFHAKWIDARATTNALPFQIPDTMDMLLYADLSMNGSLDDLLVGGEIVLLEGLYYKDFKLNLLQSVQEKKREETPQTVKTVHPFLKPLRFDVRLKHRQSFVVDNNIADLEINPDIALTGTPENPVITGSAKVADGIITYQNKSFEVQQGAVNFINPYKTEAEIDIKGNVDIRDWRITISLYGPPDRLVVELSSSPPEEDADIISLLVFKKTTYEMNEGGSGVDQSPTVLLAQLLAASFGEDIKKSTGIDVLEVEAESAEDKDSTDRIKVTVGKDLSERITVKYSVESKEGGYVQRATTEYKLMEHIIVSGFQDTKGVYGGEFIFRIGFRLFR